MHVTTRSMVDLPKTLEKQARPEKQTDKELASVLKNWKDRKE